MKKNVGKIDRVIRIILGVALLAVLVWVDSPIRFIGLLGFVMLFTATVQSCPLYLPFGLDTLRKKINK